MSSKQQDVLPVTPVPAHAELPTSDNHKQTDGSALTPPPSSQGAHATRRIQPDAQGQAMTMSEEELRSLVARLTIDVQEAKTAAAHYKLQHQMAQMESGEAVERMAVEMEMARREIEVLQQAEAQRRIAERDLKDVKAEDDTSFRKVHVDIYTALTDDLRDLKIDRLHMDRQLQQSRQVIEQQENEIASLHDKILLMRERMKESRDQLQRQRSINSSTPQTVRMTPFDTPSRERFRALRPPVFDATPRPVYQGQSRPQPVGQGQSQPQEGFAALLQATDIVSQGGHTPKVEHRKGVHSLSSLPSTPTRTVARPVHIPLYTPQPARQPQMEVPMTAPLPRKRPMSVSPTEAATGTRRHRGGYESEGTVSAGDDSEAETEVAEDDVHDSRASQYARDLLRSPTARKTKSVRNLKGGTHRDLGPGGLSGRVAL